MDKSLIPDRVTAAVENMLRSQVTDIFDANLGRTLRDYNARTGFRMYSGNWCTGIFMACLLAMYKRTGNALYLDRAEHAGHYIMSLQNMDARDKTHYGMFHESTPQSTEELPRDAVTAAWCLTWLYEATGKAEYIDRAVLFADWHLKYCMCDGWPLWAVFMDKKNTKYFMKGSFQSGTGLFYHDLFMQTMDQRYITQGLRPIADTYVRDFINPDGSLIRERNIFTNKVELHGQAEQSLDIHGFNDDFGNQMLLAAADLFQDESYREKAHCFARFLAKQQQPDGTFFNGVKSVSSAVPIALMYFDELGRYYRDETLLAAAERTFDKLLAMQILDSDDPLLKGAFEGMIETPEDDPRTIIQIRTTAYAVIALLKVEGKIRNFWLGGEHNDKFIDPINIYTNDNPYPFEY